MGNSEKSVLGFVQFAAENEHITKLCFRIHLHAVSLRGKGKPPGSDPELNNPSHFSTTPLWVRIQVRHTCPATATTGLSALALKIDADFLEYLPCNFYRNKLH